MLNPLLMTLVEFWPLSEISSVIEAVEATEAKQVEDAKTTSEEPLAIHGSPWAIPSPTSEEVEGFEPPTPIVVTNVEAELFEPETEVTVKLFRAIKRARTANKWSLRCTY